MIYYLNFGFVVEQALVDVTRTYIERLHLESVYDNFHFHVTNEHPFAHMILEDNTRAGDTFPSIIITSQSDGKVPEMHGMFEISNAVKMTSADFDDLFASSTRDRTYIDENGVVEVLKDRNGNPLKENVPGYVLIYDKERIQQLKQLADSRTTGDDVGGIYGIQINTRKRDRISVEIWCENDQLKDELYEHLTLMFTCSLDRILKEKYKMFDCSIFGQTVQGERSSNYNFDFDILLSGSHITFEIDYNVSQIILDTEINDIHREIEWEVINHVKENEQKY